MDYSLLLGIHDITRGSVETDMAVSGDSEDELQIGAGECISFPTFQSLNKLLIE